MTIVSIQHYMQDSVFVSSKLDSYISQILWGKLDLNLFMSLLQSLRNFSCKFDFKVITGSIQWLRVTHLDGYALHLLK